MILDDDIVINVLFNIYLNMTYYTFNREVIRLKNVIKSG